MKNLFLSVITSAVCFSAMCQQHNNTSGILKAASSLSATPADDNWLSASQQYLKASELYFKKEANSTAGYYAYNKKGGIGFTLSEKGYQVSPIQFSNKSVASNKWQTGLSFVSIQKGNQSIKAEKNVSVTQDRSALNFNYPGFSMEYHNETNGLRQNFVVSKQLNGAENLEVVLNINGNLSAAVCNNKLCLKDSKGITRLLYQDLNVWDANHKPLNAVMQLRDKNILAIVVKDQNATYPITIDPINQTPEWETSANGILPGLLGQLSVDAAYGFTVAGLGDVNADGFDDVAIGAPAMVDLISGTGTLASVGAVFIYYGSINGLPIVPSAQLQPTTSIAGALFGYSIAGGDVNNDGKADILVGAPLDNVSISIGGGGTASGQVGKAYLFNGATLSTTTTPFLTLQLSGSGILENGINLSVNALFGFSVGITEDLNADGKRDMIVGAPTYAGIKTGLLGSHLLDVQSGGAFVFLTNAAGSGVTITKLEPIKSSILGLGLLNTNISGLLFGYCVDGTGDYNGDGKPDVVASAPAGVDASSITGLLSGKLLQGSVSVYYGNGAGVNINPGATLTAVAGGLLSNLTGSIGNIANLFGIAVKGATDGNGIKNGNVLVGAPLGGALTNVLSLQLKTGTVNVFIKKGASPSGYVAPDQVLSSPRNDNTILGLIQANLLFGYSLNNVADVNCDGIGDIIVGEPASSGVQLINANVAGGAAYVYLGNGDGTYHTVPSFTFTAYEDAFLGANATSLIGYSVAGAGRVKGAGYSNRILVGSPSRTLDFGAGLLNLGSTLGTIFSLAAGDNGAGKAYAFDTRLCSSDLPVTFTGLKGRYANGVAYLSWQTVQEINNNHFEIEKSKDAAGFNYIGEIAGKGNSNSTVNYHFTDGNVTAVNNYYRLKLVDNNGRYSYSNIISLDAKEKKHSFISISPNPFIEKLVITIPGTINETASIKIFDNTGKPVISQLQNIHAGINTIILDQLGRLAAGVYIAEIKLNDQLFSQKIVK